MTIEETSEQIRELKKQPQTIHNKYKIQQLQIQLDELIKNKEK